MNYFFIYLILILDNLRGGFAALIIPGLICIGLSGGCILADWQYKKTTPRGMYAALGASILFLCFCFAGLIFTPTTQQAFLIAAGGKTLEFAQQDAHLKQIPGKSSELVYEFLQKQLNKTKRRLNDQNKHH